MSSSKVIVRRKKATAINSKRISQSLYFVDLRKKLDLLKWMLPKHSNFTTIVVVEDQFNVRKISAKLAADKTRFAALMEDDSVEKRQEIFNEQTSSPRPVIIATDASLKDIKTSGPIRIVNYDIPSDAQKYVDRLELANNEGEDGYVFSLSSGMEKSFVMNLERSKNIHLQVEKDSPYHSWDAQKASVLSVKQTKSMLANSFRGKN